jgi:hypothetical protein
MNLRASTTLCKIVGRRARSPAGLVDWVHSYDSRKPGWGSGGARITFDWRAVTEEAQLALKPGKQNGSFRLFLQRFQGSFKPVDQLGDGIDRVEPGTEIEVSYGGVETG